MMASCRLFRTDKPKTGQLELTIFNTSGLQPVGENLFVETTASGQAINTTPTENGAGNILQGFLEASNVGLHQNSST